MREETWGWKVLYAGLGGNGMVECLEWYGLGGNIIRDVEGEF
jgi:hypothetical protein